MYLSHGAPTRPNPRRPSTPTAATAILAALLSVAGPALSHARTTPSAAQAQPLAGGWSEALDLAEEALGLRPVAGAYQSQASALDRASRARFAGPVEAEASLRQDTIGSGRGAAETELALTVPLLRPGERDLLRAQARAGGEIARQARAVLRVEAAGDLRARWWAYAAARAIAAEDAGLARIEAEATARVAQLVEAGEMARLDLHRAELSAADAARRAGSSAAEAEAARLSLIALVGDPAPELGAEMEGAATDLHPRLALAQAELAALETRQALAAGSADPRWRVGIDVRTERGMRGEDLGVSTGIRAARPFGPDPSAATGAAGIGVERAQAQARLRQLALELETAVRQARTRLAATRAALRQAEAAHAAALEVLVLTARGSREGELSFLEELRARAVAGEAARTLVLARVGAAAAISDLNQAQGLLP